MRKHWLKLVIVCTLLAWAGNLGLYHANKLERPLFLKHYYELTPGMLDYARFYMVTNPDSDYEPYLIELPGFLQLRIEHQHLRETQGRLQLKELHVRTRIMEEKEITEPRHYEEVLVHYTNGVIEAVPIGKVVVIPHFGELALRSYSSFSSNNGTGGASYQAERDVVIDSITYRYEQRIADAMEIWLMEESIEETDLFPIAIHSGSHAALRYRLQFHEKDSRRFDAYQLILSINDEHGRTIGVDYINEFPKLYDRGLGAYVRDSERRSR